LLKIDDADLVFDNPFFQKATQQRPGCQIDYLIQTKHHTLYLCEIKFLSTEVKVSIREEIQDKIRRMKMPKHFSIRPVLVHVNGVHESVAESDFFAKIIDFSELLQ
jgi:hypothetical protein